MTLHASPSFDFLSPAGDEPHGYQEFMGTVDALVIGRKTFETVLGFGGWAYGKKPVFVLSSRPVAAAPPGAVVEQMAGAPADIASRLGARGIQNVYVDGGITIQRFLQAGLIHRLIITRIPVLIGTGIPLFGPLQRDITRTHVATRQFASGLVQSEYAVATEPLMVALWRRKDGRPLPCTTTRRHERRSVELEVQDQRHERVVGMRGDTLPAPANAGHLAGPGTGDHG